jgi:hypothetical protein
MALATYSDLLTAIPNWMARPGDAYIAAIAPDIVRIVERRLNKVLRVGDMEATETLTGTAGVFTLPSDYVQFRQVRDETYGSLELMTPDVATENYPLSQSGAPAFFTIKGSTLTTFPATVSTIVLDYYQEIPALASNSTNWLLTSSPDVYLYACVSEGYSFIKDMESAAAWDSRVTAAVQQLMSDDRLKRFSRLTTRTSGLTP